MKIRFSKNDVIDTKEMAGGGLSEREIREIVVDQVGDDIADLKDRVDALENNGAIE